MAKEKGCNYSPVFGNPLHYNKGGTGSVVCSCVTACELVNGLFQGQCSGTEGVK